MNPRWPAVLFFFFCCDERCSRARLRAAQTSVTGLLRLWCHGAPAATWWMWRTAARCHLSPNEARTSGISAVNDPLTAEQIQLSPGFLNRHQARYGRGGREGRDGGGAPGQRQCRKRRDLWERRCRRGMRGAPSAKSNHIIQRDIVKGGERMATKWQKAETGTEILVPY